MLHLLIMRLVGKRRNPKNAYAKHDRAKTLKYLVALYFTWLTNNLLTSLLFFFSQLPAESRGMCCRALCGRLGSCPRAGGTGTHRTGLEVRGSRGDDQRVSSQWYNTLFIITNLYIFCTQQTTRRHQCQAAVLLGEIQAEGATKAQKWPQKFMFCAIDFQNHMYIPTR